MLKIIYLPLWILLVTIIAIAVFVFSCSQSELSENPTPLKSVESKTSQTDFTQVPIDSDQANVDDTKLPITSVEDLHITGIAPEVDITEYRLTIDGLVDTPLTLTYEAIMKYPTVTEVLLLICPDFFMDNAEWTGVPVVKLLAEAGIQPQASKVTFYSLDGYSQTLSLEEVQRDGVYLAHTVNGQIIPKDHGYPLRLVVKDLLGNYWVKWVERIEVK